MASPQVTHYGIFDMQVCVPKTYADSQVLEFAERENICGTTSGWHIRRTGDTERVQCVKFEENCHIMLDA